MESIIKFIIQFIVAGFATLSFAVLFPPQKKNCFTAVLAAHLDGFSTTF